MAINISDQYPGRANPPSVDYPQGSIKNQTAPGARDGTPLDEAWANDKEGFFQKALSYRGVTANGTPDTATSSQYFDALFADPAETLRGMPMVATQAEVNAGALAGKMVTPKTVSSAFGIGQSFQNVTASRSIGVTYTNTTGRPITVYVLCVVNAGVTGNTALLGFIDGSAVSITLQSTGNGIAVNFVVPPGASYRAYGGTGGTSTVSLSTWMEFR